MAWVSRVIKLGPGHFKVVHHQTRGAAQEIVLGDHASCACGKKLNANNKSGRCRKCAEGPKRAAARLAAGAS